MLDNQQDIQAKQYAFPYHYLPDLDGTSFRQGRWWSFSLSYVIALTLVSNRLRQHDVRSLIDVGCGDGALLHYLNRHHAELDLSGVDYDALAIDWAKLFNGQSINLEARDILTSPLEKSYDVVTLVEVIEHILPDQLNEFLGSVRGLVQDNGYLYITVPHKNKRLFDKHYQHFDFQTLTHAVEPFFAVEEMIGFEYASRLERAVKRFLLTPNFVLDSRWLNRLRLKQQLRRMRSRKSEAGAGRIFCVCRPRPN